MQTTNSGGQVLRGRGATSLGKKRSTGGTPSAGTPSALEVAVASKLRLPASKLHLPASKLRFPASKLRCIQAGNTASRCDGKDCIDVGVAASGRQQVAAASSTFFDGTTQRSSICSGHTNWSSLARKQQLLPPLPTNPNNGS